MTSPHSRLSGMTQRTVEYRKDALKKKSELLKDAITDYIVYMGEAVDRFVAMELPPTALLARVEEIVGKPEEHLDIMLKEILTRSEHLQSLGLCEPARFSIVDAQRSQTYQPLALKWSEDTGEALSYPDSVSVKLSLKASTKSSQAQSESEQKNLVRNEAVSHENLRQTVESPVVSVLTDFSQPQMPVLNSEAAPFIPKSFTKSTVSEPEIKASEVMSASLESPTVVPPVLRRGTSPSVPNSCENEFGIKPIDFCFKDRIVPVPNAANLSSAKPNVKDNEKIEETHDYSPEVDPANWEIIDSPGSKRVPEEVEETHPELQDMPGTSNSGDAQFVSEPQVENSQETPSQADPSQARDIKSEINLCDTKEFTPSPPAENSVISKNSRSHAVSRQLVAYEESRAPLNGGVDRDCDAYRIPPCYQYTKVVETFMDEDDTFFVQLVDDADMIIRITDEVEDADSPVERENFMKGILFCAPNERGEKYRALTLSEIEDGKVLVRFVDYGDSASVNFSDLRELPDGSPSKYCRFAVQCKVNMPGLTKEQLKNLRKKLDSFSSEHLLVFLSPSEECNDLPCYDILDLHLLNENGKVVNIFPLPEDDYIKRWSLSEAMGSTSPKELHIVETAVDPGRMFLVSVSSRSAREVIESNVNKLPLLQVTTDCAESKIILSHKNRRAEVIYISDSRAQLYLIDYGIVVPNVHISECGYLPLPCLLYKPALAHKVSLANAKPLGGGSYDTSVKAKLEELVGDRKFIVRVPATIVGNKVYLIDEKRKHLLSDLERALVCAIDK